MAKTLSVDEKNVMEFLRDGATNSFLIPDYQRKYDWDPDNINLLFDDLAEFTEIHILRAATIRKNLMNMSSRSATLLCLSPHSIEKCPTHRLNSKKKFI